MLTQKKRFNWLDAGRRWRKTTLWVPLAIETVLDGKICFWGAPTYDQVRIGWNETQRAAGGIFTFNSSRMEVVYPRTGGKIVYRSLDNPDNARSHTADRFIVDEAAYIHPDAYYLVIRQMLMSTLGDFFAGSTPNGLNWFYAEWVAAHDREDSMWWQIPTVGCEIVDGQLIRKPHPYENPDIDWAEIVNLFNTLPARTFKQEIMAEFMSNEGAVFRNVGASMRTDMRSISEEKVRHQYHIKVLGVDYAKKEDFTVISIGCANCRQEIAIDRFNDIDYAFQNQRVASMWNSWNVSHGRGDSASIGEANLDHLHKDGIPIIGVPTNSYSQKAALIESLSLAMDRIEILFVPDPIGKAEMEAYEQTLTPGGKPKYGAPPGFHDDFVMARALMWQAMRLAPVRNASRIQQNPWDLLKDSE